MLFSSLEFLYGFLPLTLALYFAVPKGWKNPLLLAVSLIFYAWGEPKFLPLMLLVILADFTFGLLISRSRRPRVWLWTAIVSNLALLGFFKYFDFTLSLLGLSPLGILLPIGISFYIFQSLSYVIDVYRRETPPQASLVAFGTYVSLFPQLIAGPIVRYCDIDRELSDRTHSVTDAADGVARFCVGLSKKVLLANTAGEWRQSLLSDTLPQTLAGNWLWVLLFAFEIYFDFSGYSDMAVGLGRILGFHFPENFRYPYVSRSITDFWRRWHMTLSAWFRAYVYIPLGGNRRGRLYTYRNLLITWALTGLWHGAAWNFLLWGLYFFLLLALEKAFLLRLLDRLPRPLCHAYALFFILAGWLIFSADGLTLPDALARMGGLFGFGCESLFDGMIRYELLRGLPTLAVMAIGSTPLPHKLWLRLSAARPCLSGALRVPLCTAALLLCTAYLVDSGYNPFLYFRF